MEFLSLEKKKELSALLNLLTEFAECVKSKEFDKASEVVKNIKPGLEKNLGEIKQVKSIYFPVQVMLDMVNCWCEYKVRPDIDKLNFVSYLPSLSWQIDKVRVILARM